MTGGFWVIWTSWEFCFFDSARLFLSESISTFWFCTCSWISWEFLFFDKFDSARLFLSESISTFWFCTCSWSCANNFFRTIISCFILCCSQPMNSGSRYLISMLANFKCRSSFSLYSAIFPWIVDHLQRINATTWNDKR